MRRLLCWFGWHRYHWAMVGNTVELWACSCGRLNVQFADDPLALSEVEQLERWMKHSEGNRVGR